MKTRRWWGGKKPEYEYTLYSDIAAVTGRTISCEAQRCKRIYKKIATAVVKDARPHLSPTEQLAAIMDILNTAWWEDVVRGTYVLWCEEKNK